RGQATQFAENFDSGPFARIPLIILSIFLIGLSGLETWSLHQDDSLGVFALILLVGAFASGICLLCMALLGPKGKNVAIPATIPVFWLTVWLIYFHVETAASPVRLGYIYGFFALAALLLSFYYIAGYAFRQTRERRLMFCGSAAIYFSGVVAGGSLGLSFIGQIILPVLGAMVLVYLLLLARNLTRPAPQAHPRTVSPDLLGDEADV
ncbi:MAG: hypothetical protein FWC72_04550, partial [Oscillospiraceae bacterium]|nr:hypothetical protein [Oscillospiraceae bacterium]